VLGQETLRLVWAEMRDIVLPSEVSRAPGKAGAPGQGSLSADEWRTFCTVNLVITLGWAWGSLPSDRRERKLLDNFMNLVTVVKLATARSVTSRSLWEIQTNMHQYLKQLLVLFPGTSVSPYQHMCLGHLATVFETLGPAPAIWCFVFERANFILQRIKTNSRIDDLSATLLNRFCTRQNLRALFSRLALPQMLRGIIPTFVKTFESDIRGTLNSILSESLNPEANENVEGDEDDTRRVHKLYTLTQEVFDALRTRLDQPSRRAIPLKVMELRGARYKPMAAAQHDSIVVFRRNDDADWQAGCIRELFKQEGALAGDSDQWTTWLIVDVYKPLTSQHEERDPYRNFPIAGGRLFYSEFLPKPVALVAEEIICHAALMRRILPTTDVECVHVLPLDKV
ncbi:uncharacterized protein B0H18DRAFT_878881, partial [Fomitopsis serialis]|uniref:uncharacterized protein n=1 Tax=Fomitopsis serialis TaxID=139415 RepID=UPI002008E639